MQRFKTNKQTQFLTQLKQDLKLEIVNRKLKQFSLFTPLRALTFRWSFKIKDLDKALGIKGPLPSVDNVSKIIMYSTNVSLTILLINRWINSGHFPLSNLYESLIFLSWSFTIIYTLVSFTLGNEAKTTLLPIISWCAVPITLFTCGYAFFCVPQELQKAESLVPALQSNWLIMHVSVMILSYASLILGSLFAFSLLLTVIFDSCGWKMVSPATFGGNLKVLDRNCIVKSNAPTPLLPKEEFMPKAAVTATSTATANTLDKTGDLDELEYKQNYAIKDHNFLDNLSYRFIGLGFALLTLGIISGAVWANSAWGSYWSWDPKETWAFITWLTYAIYLHLRISQGWYGKQSAYVAFFGFFVVWFCYLGVNLFGKGLHSYAFV